MLCDPKEITTIWPVDINEVELPQDIAKHDTKFALGPCIALTLLNPVTPTKCGLLLLCSVARQIQTPNLTDDPLILKSQNHFCHIHSVNISPGEEDMHFKHSNSKAAHLQSAQGTPDMPFSASITVDPDNIHHLEISRDSTPSQRV